jgi:hypothetical protein
MSQEHSYQFAALHGRMRKEQERAEELEAEVRDWADKALQHQETEKDIREAERRKMLELETKLQLAKQQLTNLQVTLAGREQVLASKDTEIAHLKSQHQVVLEQANRRIIELEDEVLEQANRRINGLEQAHRRINELEDKLATRQMSLSTTEMSLSTTIAQQDDETKELKASKLLHEQLLASAYACAHCCEFVGGYAQVEAHELGCANRPPPQGHAVPETLFQTARSFEGEQGEKRPERVLKSPLPPRVSQHVARESDALLSQGAALSEGIPSVQSGSEREGCREVGIPLLSQGATLSEGIPSVPPTKLHTPLLTPRALQTIRSDTIYYCPTAVQTNLHTPDSKVQSPLQTPRTLHTPLHSSRSDASSVELLMFTVLRGPAVSGAANESTGLGLSMAILPWTKGWHVVVTALLEGGSAVQDSCILPGILPGDIITHIQGEPVGQPPIMAELIARIKGKPSSGVELRLERGRVQWRDGAWHWSDWSPGLAEANQHTLHTPHQTPCSDASDHSLVTLARGLNGLVGISFGKAAQSGPYTVMEVSSQGAAHRSGLLKSGDLIHSIQQQSVYNLDSRQVSELLTGPPGSTVSFVISRLC